MSMQTAENSAVGNATVNTAPAGVSSGSGFAGSASKNSGDGAAAVNNTSRSGNTVSGSREKSFSKPKNDDSVQGKPSRASNEAAKDVSGQTGERVGYIDKPTPKSTSEAINRATERYKRKIEAYEQREQRLGELLKSAGITGDLETGISQLSNARNVPTEAANRSPSAARDSSRGVTMRNAAGRDYAARDVSARDHELLGNADADEIIRSGDVDAEIKRLEDKPVSLRTRRDRQCYLRLTNERQSRRDLEALGKLGVDVEKLKKDGAFAEFDANLNPDIPVSERYELFKKYCVMKKAVKPPMSASSRGNTPKREYFDSDTIDGMSREEIAANLAAITRSMKSW